MSRFCLWFSLDLAPALMRLKQKTLSVCHVWLDDVAGTGHATVHDVFACDFLQVLQTLTDVFCQSARFILFFVATHRLLIWPLSEVYKLWLGLDGVFCWRGRTWNVHAKKSKMASLVIFAGSLVLPMFWSGQWFRMPLFPQFSVDSTPRRKARARAHTQHSVLKTLRLTQGNPNTQNSFDVPYLWFSPHRPPSISHAINHLSIMSERHKTKGRVQKQDLPSRHPSETHQTQPHQTTSGKRHPQEPLHKLSNEGLHWPSWTKKSEATWTLQDSDTTRPVTEHQNTTNIDKTNYLRATLTKQVLQNRKIGR